MAHLTENEVADRMRSSLKEAIQACKDLAVKSRAGAPYDRLRDNLALIEGSCRQMAAFRGDATWLPFGMYMAECHKRAGGWLRGYVDNGIHVTWSPGHINKVFVTLAAQLVAVLDALDVKVDAKTGVNGPVLPERPAAERRVGAPVSMSGIIQPAPKPALIIPANYRRA